ncbi:MAG: DoxX family membrane protein [Deltaproteobacteria bacterium]
MKTALRMILAVAMMAIGVLHLVDPGPFVGIVPAALPAPVVLVYVSGIFEIAGGLGLLLARTRRAAAWGLVALYVAVFPANINMAVNHLRLGSTPVSPALAWGRLPLQIVFIAWAWWFTRPDAPRGTGSRG